MERREMDVNEYLSRLCSTLRGQLLLGQHCMPPFTPDDQHIAKTVIDDLLLAIERATANLVLHQEDPRHSEKGNKRQVVDGAEGPKVIIQPRAVPSAADMKKRRRVSTRELVFDTVEDDVPPAKCVSGALNPNWMGRLYWDLFIMCLVMLDSFMLPAQLAWQNPEETFGDKIWLWFTTGCFVADMCASSMTAYVSSGVLITNKVFIASHYFRGWFVVDFASTVPWSVVAGLISPGSGSQASAARSTRLVKFIRFVRLLRMMRLAKLAAMWDRIEEMIGSLMLRHALQIMKHMGMLVVCCHLNACVWWMLGNPDGLLGSLIEDQHWGESIALADPPWIERPGPEQYVFCFYWTLGLMRTMPAEVTPVNVVERLYILGFMCFAFSAFAICVSQVSTMWIKINQRSRDFDDELSHVRMRLKNNACDPRLVTVIKEFMRYKFDNKLGSYAGKANQIMSMLPQKMRDLINFSRWLPYLRKLKLLQEFRDEDVIRRICEGALSEEDHPTGQKISEKGRLATHCFILTDGALKSVSSSVKEPIEVVDEHCLSGLGGVSEHTLVTVSCVQFLKVDGVMFAQAMEQHRRNPGVVWHENACSVAGGRYLEEDMLVYDRSQEEAAIGTTAVLAAS